MAWANDFRASKVSWLEAMWNSYCFLKITFERTMALKITSR